MDALTIKEMQKLQSLGLDTSDASMMWVWDAKDDDWICISRSAKNYYLDCMTGHDLPEYISAYTLQDILKKLPIDIVAFKDGSKLPLLITVTKSGNYAVVYDNPCIKNGKIGLQISYSVLEASYQMLLWCIENNYIKTNKV